MYFRGLIIQTKPLMKNICFLSIILLSVTVSFSQKKGKLNVKKKEKSGISLAKTANIIFEMNKNNGQNQLYLLLGPSKDTLLVKSVTESVIISPLSCKLKNFDSAGTQLLNISWTENTVTGDAKTKLESATRINNDIWDVVTRNQVFSNTQTTTNIKEIVFLDRLKNASETQERNRKEGFEFTLQPNGDVHLLNKSITNIMTYSPSDKKYKMKKK